MAGKRCWISDEGQSLVEFAITLPMLLLAVGGIMVFGLAFDNYVMLTEATAVGARQLAISRGQTLDPCHTVATAVYAAAPLLISANMTIKVTLNGNLYPGTSCPGTTTSGAPASMVLGTNATVNVTYPYTLSSFRNILPSSFLLTAQTSEMMQ